MPKVIIYDIDRGLSSVGSDERIEGVFGYKPRKFIRSQSVMDFFNKIHKPEVRVTEDALGPVEEEVYTIRDGYEVDFEVLDSITATQAQKKKEVRGDAARISLPQWGEIGEAIEELVFKLTRTDTNVIMIGHTKSEEDSDLGIVRQIPALSGRMSNEIARSFDIVAYTKVETDTQTQHRSYYWQIIADERRSAKCRIEEVSKYAEKNGGCIPQDFTLLWNLIKDAGHKSVKMLILGDSGTGKTYALRTLKGLNG